MKHIFVLCCRICCVVELFLMSNNISIIDCPQDPFMLLSFINTKLRDEYATLDDLCKSLDVERVALEEKLAEAGFIYMEHINQFK